MIIKIDCTEEFNKAIKKQIPKEFLDYNPYIAGGFTLGCFIKYFKNKKSLFLKHFPEGYSVINDEKNSYDSPASLNALFEDVDLFYLNKSMFAKSLFECADEDCVDKYLESKMLCNSKLGYSCNRISKHAITIQKGNSVFFPDLQLIKHKLSDVEDLFRKFDIHNCCIAWNSGSLYMTKDFLKSIMLKEISYNVYYNVSKDVVSEVYQCMRILKYFKRYAHCGYDYSETSYNRLMSVYSKLSALDIENSDDPVIVNNSYGSHILRHSIVYEMIMDFVNNFKNLENSKCFKKEDLLFLLASDIPLIKGIIKRNFSS